MEAFLGAMPGSIGETSTLAILLGMVPIAHHAYCFLAHHCRCIFGHVGAVFSLLNAVGSDD